MSNLTGNDDNGAAQASREHYELRLFVIGASPNSVKAIANIKLLCEKHLKGHYSLEIVDVHQQGLLAEQEQIIALPLLLKLSPLPLKRLIGDMSDHQKVLRGLGIVIETS